MIGLLPDLPPNVAGFKATGEVTKEDYEKVVYPEVRRHSAVSSHLSFVFYVDTPLKNFSAGAWLKDIWLGMKGLAMWHRVAIISDVERIRVFTNTISHLLPGEYKGFPVERLQEAIRWAATEEKKQSSAQAVAAYIEQLLPVQTKGESTVTSAEVSAGRESDARFIFERASERLLDVNQWTDHCGALAAGFQLADDTGEPLEGRAAVGDYIRIDIPGPGPAEGRGYDWVRIEKIERHRISTRTGEEEAPDTGRTMAGVENLSLLQVRPCAHPQKKDAAVTAHFLEDSATSTFIIEWEGKKIRATVFGRNEVPNTEEPGVGDRVRNAVVGSLGAIGLSKVQWKALVQGLLEKE